MDKFDQNRPNQRSIHKNSWNRNSLQRDQVTQRRYTFHSNWPSRPQIVRRMPVRNILPGSEKYWCETCDKGFMSRIQLNNHIQRHQKCNIDGCEFVAHPLVITKHIQMQHATGLYKRIGKLNNPEEIKKWRNERKKKYPTRENIERKQAEIKERIGRGEKMGLQSGTRGFKRSVSNKAVLVKGGRQTISSHKYIRTSNNTKIPLTQTSIKKRPLKQINKIGPPKEEARKLQPFTGIQGLIIEDTIEEESEEESNDFFEDEEDISEKGPNLENKQPTVCGALSSLMFCYESSDEEIEENSKTTSSKQSNTINTNKIILNEEPDKKQNKTISKNIHGSNDSENESGPEETAINKVGSTNDEPRCVKQSKKERLQKLALVKNRNKIVNLKKKIPSTLLEKLLHREIKHERNVILQCIRYVVQNNFFDKTKI